MEKRLNKGDLVAIAGGHRYPPVNSDYGIIVEVLERNTQNPEWDKYLVMWNNQIDALPARRLELFNLNKIANSVQKYSTPH